MPPKAKFTKQSIIDAAFEIAKVEGLGGITIRKVADKLGSSIAPIYVNFKDVEELTGEVVRSIFELSRRLLKEHDTGNPFHDIGAASLRFAREYSVLFRDLALKPNDHMSGYEEELTVLVAHMKSDPELEGFTEEELKGLLFKMRIFQLGLSVMVANGLLPDGFGEEMEQGLLDSTAKELIAAARMRKKGLSI
ncbi:TetR/AcrR family transcriptional regulator [Paenibacillus sp. GCM10012303]|uniref:TetR/AcrR family transcriptional regulator n=1 Tax=Paenibacillus sp. GCM10012303 TaxID=3317340 RepID=UPI0036240CC7